MNLYKNIFLLLLLVCGNFSFAQTYNNVKCGLISPYPPGGNADLTARLMQKIEPEIKIEYKPGAYYVSAFNFMQQNKNFFILGALNIYSNKNPIQNMPIEITKSLVLHKQIALTNSEVTISDLKNKPLNIGVAVLGGPSHSMALEVKEQNPLVQIIPTGGEAKALPLLVQKSIDVYMGPGTAERWVVDYNFKTLFLIPADKKFIKVEGIKITNNGGLYAFIHKDASTEQRKNISDCLQNVTQSDIWSEKLPTVSASPSTYTKEDELRVVDDYRKFLQKYDQ